MALIIREGGRTIPTCAVGGARGLRFPALLRGPRARRLRPSGAASRPDRRAQRDLAARARRLRLHLAVEFPAGDLHRAGRGCAGRRQHGHRQAGRADPAGRRRGGAAPAWPPASRRMRCISCPATARASARALVADPRVAGVAFTGSTETARAINRVLAQRAGPIVPLIAETGGQNAMIVDSSALPEQVVADVVTSAFDSAGQRCSALRLLYVQEDVAERILAMLAGAMAELRIGDPGLLATDIGPVIDAAAREPLQRHAERMSREGRLLYQCSPAARGRARQLFRPARVRDRQCGAARSRGVRADPARRSAGAPAILTRCSTRSPRPDTR